MLIQEIRSCFKDEYGDYFPEGTLLTLNVIRNEETVGLKFPSKYKMGTVKNRLKNKRYKTKTQQKLFDIWKSGVTY